MRSIGIGDPAAIPVLQCHPEPYYHIHRLLRRDDRPELTEVNSRTLFSPFLDFGEDAQEVSGHTVQGRTSFLSNSVDDGFGIERLRGINYTRSMGPGC